MEEASQIRSRRWSGCSYLLVKAERLDKDHLPVQLEVLVWLGMSWFWQDNRGVISIISGMAYNSTHIQNTRYTTRPRIDGEQT